MHKGWFGSSALAGMAVAVLGAVGCSSAPADETSAQTKNDLIIQTCAPGQTLECTSPADPGDGVKNVKQQCACMSDAPPPPPPPPGNPDDVWAIQYRTNLPHDWTNVFTASSPGTYGSAVFAYPPELVGKGCTQTAVYRHDGDDRTGGRTWACPLPPNGVPFRPQALGGTSTCSPATNTKAFVGPTEHAPSSGHLGTPISGWYFIDESCIPSDAPAYPFPDGMACGGPCMFAWP